MKDLLKTLEKLAEETDKIIVRLRENGETGNIDISGIVARAADLIRFNDPDKIEYWKKNNNRLFLQFVPTLEKILRTLSEYTESVNPLVSSVITSEISEEIAGLGKKISSDLNNLQEKDKFGPGLEALTRQKNQLEEINDKLNNYDLKKLKQEINNLTKKNNKLQAEIEPLLSEKAALAELVSRQEKLADELRDLRNTNKNSINRLIDKISEAAAFIEDKQEKWHKDKKDILNKVNNELEKFRETEAEIGRHLSELAGYRNAYLKNREIIEKHFSTDKKILNSLPTLKESLVGRLASIEEEIGELDLEIEKFIGEKQKVSDQVIKNPLTFDYM